jgi:hypothetical protein
MRKTSANKTYPRTVASARVVIADSPCTCLMVPKHLLLTLKARPAREVRQAG